MGVLWGWGGCQNGCQIVQAENNKAFIIEMGQAQSASSQDDNCFRACIKEKRTTSKKIQASPHYPQQNMDYFTQEHHPPNQHPPNTQHPPQHPNNQKVEAEGFETSLEQRLYTADIANKKKCLVQYSTDIMTVEAKQQPMVEGRLEQSTEIVLGLQSKFVGEKSNAYGRAILTKGSVICAGGSPVTRGNSNEKESGSQTETTSKSNRTSFSTKSRNILLNKIESIKQKYYERELEIEIYQDEKDYEEQVNQINQIERTFTLDNSCLPEQSIGEIKAIREKILKKLREKKQQSIHEPILPTHIQDQSLNVDKSLYDQLELYSREGRGNAEEVLNESQRVKKSKRMKNSISTSGRLQLNKSLNRSLSASLPDVSTDEKIEFSQYSEESLHEIRQLDEQYEEYKSKMSAAHKSKVSNIHKNTLNNPSHHLLRGPSKQPSKIDQEPQSASSQLPAQQLSAVKSESSVSKSKQEGVHYSKGNKILLF